MQFTEEEKILWDLDKLEYFDYKYGIPKSSLFDNEIYYPIYDTDKQHVLLRGGRASGKSRAGIGQNCTVLSSCLPFCRIVVVRQYFNSIKGSSFQEIKDYISEWGLDKYFNIRVSPMTITHKESGNFIKFAGLDKPDSIKGIKDITHIIFEEASQIKDWSSVSTVMKSVRTPKFDNHKFFYIFNPDNIDHWLYDIFYNEQTADRYSFFRDNSLLLHTTYKDNKFLPKSYVKLLEADRIADPERAKVDCDGEWGTIRKTGLWYQNFDPSSQVVSGLKSKIYDKNKPIYLSFDFNVWPYISLEIGQEYHDKETNEYRICVVGEICLDEGTYKDKSGDVAATCREFISRYYKHEGLVYICGDRSGHNRKTNSVSDFATIFAMLGKTKYQDYQVIKDGSTTRKVDPYPEYEEMQCVFKVVDLTIKGQNPRLDARNLFFKRLFAGTLTILPPSQKFGTKNRIGQVSSLAKKYAGCKVVLLIDSSCKYLIKDYNEVERKEDGRKDESNKEITHTSDAMDYMAVKLLYAEFKKCEADLSRNR